MNSICEKLIEIEKNNQKAAFCVVVKTEGSTPRKAGAKMIVFDNNHIPFPILFCLESQICS